MKITVRVKLEPSAYQADALAATLRACNRAANYVSEVAFESGEKRRNGLQPMVYRHVKDEFNLSAQPAVRVVKKVCDAYATLRANIRAGNLGPKGGSRRNKAESKPVVFREGAAQAFDDRCLSWQADQRTVSIWTTAGRLKGIRFVCSERAAKMIADQRQGESDLVLRDGAWYLFATCELPVPLVAEPADWLGVDLGIVNIATTSDGTVLSGRRLERYRFHSWAFAQLGAFVEYKAQRAGVPVVHVNPANTSRQCSACWHTHRQNRVDQATFACRACGTTMHADVNGSRNIRHRAADAWKRGAVDRPSST
ncbi:transposase [Kitasatospora sp. NPDC002227]|uniref:RNA-guided endonuclease InsQ/TnpB family protein n=1 Tax=Kitasatospora sp. NPDC002227 TaxID=3154773 RepID=UPI003319CB4C